MREYTIQPAITIIIGLILLATLTSCSESANPIQNSPKDGETLFRQVVIGGNAGCATCHSIDEDIKLIGPSLARIGLSSAQRVDGQSAEVYLRESILKPDAFVVEGFPAGVMPDSYGENLSTDEVDRLVNYLLMLK